jgi:hypothetical protein
MDFAYDRDDLVAAYRQYLKLMAHWQSVLPADRFLVVQYEELVADREAMTRKMIAFCGLDWDDRCLRSERNPRSCGPRSVRTASVWQARQPVYKSSVARRRRYEPWLGSLRELLTDAERADTFARAARNSPTRKELADGFFGLLMLILAAAGSNLSTAEQGEIETKFVAGVFQVALPLMLLHAGPANARRAARV